MYSFVPRVKPVAIHGLPLCGNLSSNFAEPRSGNPRIATVLPVVGDVCRPPATMRYPNPGKTNTSGIIMMVRGNP